MPLDQDVNQAISRLHFGTTLPFWYMAVKVQYNRLAPMEEWVVKRVAAAKRCEAGQGSDADKAAAKELADLIEQRFYDAYVIGEGHRRDLIQDPGEGLGVTEDQDGHMLISWGGNRVRLLEAADAGIALASELNRQFWGALTTP